MYMGGGGRRYTRTIYFVYSEWKKAEGEGSHTDDYFYS